VLDLVVKKDAAVTTEFEPSLLNGIQVIKTSGFETKKTLDGKVEMLGEEPVKLIPYALWNNRGAGQMMVWFPTNTETGYYIDGIHGDDNYPGTVKKPIKSEGFQKSGVATEPGINEMK
jgi:hypothetical protein